MVETRKSLAAYLTAALLSLAAAAGALELWRADLRIPLVYGSDALCMQLWIKGLIDHGWYLTNPSVGAPFGLDMHDFPLVDSLFFLILKLVSRATTDPFLVENLYFLSTFPLTAVSALFVFRRFDVPRAPAVVASVLFACLPYHFLQGEEHLFLASYFLVPLAVLVCLWVYRDGGILCARDGDGARSRLRLGGRKAWGSLVVCLLLGCGGVYYAFFTCYLLLIAGPLAALRRRQWAPLGSAGVFAAVIALGVLGNLAPKVVYQVRHGPNPDAVQRLPAHAELLGMKLIQLLLPVEGHRARPLAQLREQYESAQHSTFYLPELKTGSLGVIGSLGFVALLGGALMRGSPGCSRLWGGLIALNVAAVLLATTGGIGAVLSYLATPLIRAYTRMSIFVAFFAFFAVALGLARVIQQARTTGARLLVHMGLGILLIVGLWDQITPALAPSHASIKRGFESDEEFVRRLEGSLPARAMVFQLPFTEFPEPTNVGTEEWYQHFRLPLHSRALRWSFGAMKGRYASSWQSHVADQPRETMVQTLALAGFGGIAVNRLRYPDRGAALEADLARQLGVGPVASHDGSHAFFHLAPFAARLRQALPPEEWAARRKAALQPVTVTWRGDFSGLEVGSDGAVWRWCGPVGELILTNPSHHPRRVDLSMTLTTLDAPARVWIRGPDGTTDGFPIDPKGQEMMRSLLLPPGSSRLRLRCNGRPVDTPQDPRSLIFRITRFAVAEPDTSRRGDAALAAQAGAARH